MSRGWVGFEKMSATGLEGYDVGVDAAWTTLKFQSRSWRRSKNFKLAHRHGLQIFKNSPHEGALKISEPLTDAGENSRLFMDVHSKFRIFQSRSWTRSKDFRAAHGHNLQFFKNFRAAHGHPLKISKPLMDAAWTQPQFFFKIREHHMVAP